MRKISALYSILFNLVFGMMMVLVPGVGWGQTTFNWNFGTASGNASPSSGSLTNLTVSNISIGNTNGTVTMLSTTSASTGYTGSSGLYNAGNAARIGALATGTDGSAYFEFTLTPNTGYISSLTSISFGSRSTSTAPQAYTLRSSSDSYGTDIATGTMTNNSTWALKSNTGFTSNSGNGTAITYRIYGYNGTGSPSANTINWRIDDLSIVASISSSTPTIELSSPSQVTTGNLNQGSTKQVLSHFQVAITTANATLNSLAFTTAGSYVAGDMMNFQLYYATTDVIPSSSIGTLNSSLGTGGHTFSSLNQAINAGTTGYFWITCDVYSGATAGNTINVAADPVLTFTSGTPTGSISAGGAQTIQAVVPEISISSPNPAVGTANITQNTLNNVIYRFDNAVTVANATISGLQVTTAGTYAAADLSNLKAWLSSDATFNSGSDILLSTKTTSIGSGLHVFPSWTNQSISSGSTGYVFLTADMPCAAAAGNTISVNAVTTADVTFLTGNKTGTTNAGDAQTIVLATPSNVTAPVASVGNAQSIVSWTNPADCYNEIMVIASLSSVSGTPGGDGTAYSGDLTFANGTAFGGGYVVYKGSASPQTVTGLAMGTNYYYKLFTRNGTNWSAGVEVSATTVKAEPTNHVTLFTASAGSPSFSSISVSWTDATGGILPENYLIKASTVSYADIASPLDGSPEDNGPLVKNVAQGIQTSSFTGLDANTTYYFKIFPYTNTGGNINYKTNETVPTSTAGTTIAPPTIAGWDFSGVGGTLLPTYAATTFSPYLISASGSSDISRGASAAWSTGTNSFRTQGFQNNGISTSNTDYFQVTLTTVSGFNLSLSTIDAKFAGTGSFCVSPGVASQFAYSLDGTNFTLIGSSQSIIGTPNTLAQIDLSGISALQNIASGTTVTLRYYASGQTTTGGWGFTSPSSAENGLAIGGFLNITSTTFSGVGNWSTSGNWNNGIPSASINAIIDGVATIDALSETNSLTINSGKSLTINPAQYLTVNGALTNNAGITGLVIKSSATGTGSLIHTTASVPATVERYITGASEAWHLLSSPVSAQAITGDFIPSGSYPDGSGYDFFMWQESSMTWVNKKNTGTSPTWLEANGSNNFVVGRGYMAAYQATNPVKTFTGNLNNGIIYMPLTNSGTGTYAKTNLVGNPYPSSIDWKNVPGLDKSDLLVATGGGYNMYIYNQAASNYGAYNNLSISDEGTNGTSRYIPPMQGFFVTAKTGTLGSGLGFDDDARVHSSQGWLKNGEASSLRLTVTAPQNSGSDEVMIEFGHPTNIGGAEKWFSMVNTAPALYTVKDNGKYSIDFLSSVDNNPNIPVDFKAGVDGEYSMKATLSQNFGFVTLEDLATGIKTDLRNNPVYSFNATTTDSPARFLLHFSGVGIQDPASSIQHPISIHTSGNTLVISGNSGETIRGEVWVYNMVGQVVIHQSLDHILPARLTLGGVTGYFVVKVITGDQVCSEKVFIR